MSRKRRSRSASDTSGGEVVAERNAVIERGIDAINALRVEMRKAGMGACANALDEAFAHCLRDYVTLQADDASSPEAEETSKDKKLN